MAPEETIPAEADPSDLEATDGAIEPREDLPEADAVEQAAPVERPGGHLPASVGDLPEADAIEQSLDAGPDDEGRV